jgi:hypothetical protein
VTQSGKTLSRRHADTRRAHQNHLGDPVRPVCGHLQRDTSAQRITDDRGLLDAVCVEERPDVVGPGAQRIDDVIGALGGAETDDIRSEYAESLRQGSDVVLPVGHR